MIRSVALCMLLLLVMGGSAWSQASLNLKVKAGAAVQAFLENPSTQRLDGNHPLRVATEVQSLVANGQRRPEKAELSRIYTVDIGSADPYALLYQLDATGEFEWVEVNHTIQLPLESRVKRRAAMGSAVSETFDLGRVGVGLTARPNDDSLDLQWFHEYIGTFTAWDTTRGDSNVLIGIIDTGLDYDHPEFVGQVAVSPAEDANGNGRFDPWPDTTLVNGVPGDFDGTDADGNGYIDDVIGYDFTDQPRSPFGGDFLNEDPDPYDDNDHGTLVAGITSAKENNGYGIAGVAPGCRLKVLRAFAANGGGEDDDIARAIVYAADNGIRLLNFSFGDIYPSQMMHEAIHYAYAKDVVMIASAGNGTGDNIHYPSNFDEVIAVSATALTSDQQSEILWPLSSFGWTVSLAAPGSGIYTTVVRDTSDAEDLPFNAFSGTSTSAPMVTAAAALIFSQRGPCSPQQIRGLLTASADDVSSSGWDHLTGAGRLNIPRALATVGASNVSILSPRNDAGGGNGSLPIIVTALDPEFVSLELEYQPGLEGDRDWISLVSGITEQRLADTLTEWDLSALAEGEYTLRLKVNKSNGRTAEDRVRVVVDRSVPQIELRVVAQTWDNDAHPLMVAYRSSDRGRTELHYRPVGATDYQVLTYDRITRNGHFLLGRPLIESGDLEFFLRSVNEVGLAGSTAPQTFSFQEARIPSHLFDTLEHSIPMGHYLPQVSDFDNDGLQEVVMSEYNEQLSFGQLRFWEFNGVTFSLADSIDFKPILIPKDVGDSDNDGLLEVLCSVNDSLYVVEQENSNSFPKLITASDLDNGSFAAQFADPDQDGTLEVIAKDFQNYRVLEPNGAGFDLAATLEDISPNYQGSVAPRSLVEDFDGDGNMEIVFGDFDGDLLVYEYEAGNYVNRLVDTTRLSRSGTYLTAGDFDGDGQMEFAVAAHSQLNRNEADFEYEPPFWWVRIFKATGDNTYSILWQDYFFDIDTDGFNALSAGNLDQDPEDELIFSTFPRDYIFEWDGMQMQPSWFWYGNLTTHHVVADLDGNGVNELAIGRGDKALFWEKDVAYDGPEPASGLDGQVLGQNEVALDWVGNAPEYLIWRGEINGGGIFISLIDSSTTTEFIDQGLVAGQTYLYVVESKDVSLATITSGFSNPVVLTPGARGQLDSVVALSATQAQLHFSVPVQEEASALPLFTLNGSQGPNSLISSGDAQNTLILSFAEPFQTSNLLEVDSSFTDARQTLLDPNSLLQTFSWNPDPTSFAYFSRWEIVDEKTARIWFNEPMTASVLEQQRYQLAPAGRVVSVAFAEADQQSILVEIEEAVLGALGYPVSITLNSGDAQSGASIQEKEGNVATFSASQTDLTQVYVYPNPYQGNELFEGVRFANLVAQCTVTVYTASGRLVTSLEESDGDGGLEWDLRNTAGERVVPGTYLFRVEAEGEEEFVGTFSVLR